ncbi:MAG: peptidylprolyl isomerase [Myxococcota bacterium]|nr:peptidylprolyl isomerase [Myxococcota bacterium]
MAKVNGEFIYGDEFRLEVARLQIDDPEGEPTSSVTLAQVQTLLSDVINRRLLFQAATARNVLVSLNEIEASYTRMRSGWEPTAFESMLEDRDQSHSELKQELRRTLTVQRYLRDHVYSRVAVTDEDILAFAEAHPERLHEPEKVRVLQFIVATEEEAKDLARQIRRGKKSFEEVAMEHSKSPEGRNGGDLGFFARDEMPAVFERAFKMWPGQVSEVLESDYGFHVIKLIERRPEREVELLEIRDQIESELRRRLEREALTRAVTELREAASVELPEENELAKYQNL